jgi:hypothetical protein
MDVIENEDKHIKDTEEYIGEDVEDGEIEYN